MRRRKIILGIVIAGIALNLLLLVNSERLVKMGLLKLAEATDVVAAARDVNPDTLTIKDFSHIPGVTQEYVDAHKLFLKAKARHKEENTYAKAVVAFEGIVRTTKNPELKVRSLYLVTFCNFLQGKIDDAYKSGMEVLSLSKKLLKGDKRVSFLDRTVSSIKKGEISQLFELKGTLQSEESLGTAKEEVSGSVEDFFLFYEKTQKPTTSPFEEEILSYLEAISAWEKRFSKASKKYPSMQKEVTAFLKDYGKIKKTVSQLQLGAFSEKEASSLVKETQRLHARFNTLKAKILEKDLFD